MDRRDFLKVSGLSFALALSADGWQLLNEAQAATAQKINAWVRIAPDGTVTILTAGAEMGQGSMTSLPLIVADEMDADWSKVQLEWAPADPSLYGYSARGSQMSVKVPLTNVLPLARIALGATGLPPFGCSESCEMRPTCQIWMKMRPPFSCTRSVILRQPATCSFE